MPSAEDAVAGADVVTTATASKVRASVLRPDMVEAGMHLNAIGGDCPGKTELMPAILDMGPVFVEFTEQARVEGEIQQMRPDFVVTELWEVLAGVRAGRTSRDQITIFDSVGFALEDFTTLVLVNELADKHGIGRDLDLVPSQPDVDDLYGLLVSRR